MAFSWEDITVLKTSQRNQPAISKNYSPHLLTQQDSKISWTNFRSAEAAVNQLRECWEAAQTFTHLEISEDCNGKTSTAFFHLALTSWFTFIHEQCRGLVSMGHVHHLQEKNNPGNEVMRKLRSAVTVLATRTNTTPFTKTSRHISEFWQAIFWCTLDIPQKSAT